MSDARLTYPVAQTFGCPLRHCGQAPQNPDRQATTWSPGFTVVTAPPTASTTPDPSWPITMAWSRGGRSPST